MQAICQILWRTPEELIQSKLFKATQQQQSEMCENSGNQLLTKVQDGREKQFLDQNPPFRNFYEIQEPNEQKNGW
jgi:hypothetical protein